MFLVQEGSQVSSFAERGLPMPHMNQRDASAPSTFNLSEIALTQSERITTDNHLSRVDLDLSPRECLEQAMMKMSPEERAAFVAGVAVGRSI